MISDDLQFWHEDLFDFSHHCRDTNPRRLAKRIRTLLDDDGLKLVLSRKTGWQFSCIQALFATAWSIPGLSRNTQRITLRYFEGDHIESAIYFLAGFSNVTQLTIDCKRAVGDNRLDFDVQIIVESCPHLETLIINDLQDHDGSLRKAAKLQKLDITFYGGYDDLGERSFFLFDELPVNSAQSLQSLGICVCVENDDDESFLLDLFDSYVNLTEFKTQALNSLLCKVLTHGKFMLTSLDVACWFHNRDLSVEVVLEVFYAQSLEYLRHLVFNFQHTISDPTLDVDLDELDAEEDELVSAIANLRHLETLDLKTTCYTSWFERFAQLRHLKSISVSVWHTVFDDDPATDGTVP
jgi:hypothetical protein